MKRWTVAALPLFLLLLSGGCAKNEPVPYAAFAFSGTNQFMVPCTVQFINQSVDAYSWDWWAGTDSSIVGINPPASTLKDPVFTYDHPGNFTVTMRAYTESRKEWATVKQVITIRDTLK
jgi:PKD repeat protein